MGQKQPNPYGLYDMHGNMREWVEDWDGAYPTTAVTDPAGPASGREPYRPGRQLTSRFSTTAGRRTAASPCDYVPSSNTGFRLAKSQ